MSFMIGTIAGVVVSMLLVLIRGLLGKTAFDRILAGNAFGTATVVIIALMSVSMNDSSFLDIALIYALINFVTTIAILQYFDKKSNRKAV
jgi:multicomponent Na+:H+ antiporter subunit F